MGISFSEWQSAVGGNIHYKADMEVGASGYHGFAVFRYFTVEDIIAFISGSADGIHGADSDAAAAANTFVVVNGGLAVCNGGSIMGADFDTAAAADAVFLLHIGLACVVHFHLAGAGSAAHADILERAAETGGFVSLEMAESDKNIRIHNGAADFGFLYIFPAFYGNQFFIGSLQSIGNDDMAAGGKWGKTILVGCIYVIQGILSTAHIQCVAVREECLAAEFFDYPLPPLRRSWDADMPGCLARRSAFL